MDTIFRSDAVTASSPASYSPGSAAAFRKGTEMMAAAYKEFGDLVVGTVHSQYDQTMAACQAMAKAESVKDALTIQGDYMRGYTQTALTGSTQFLQCYQRLAHETMASMAARLPHVNSTAA